MKKHVFIMNIESRAMFYGIGTYTRQLINALKTASIQITLVTLYNDNCAEMTVYHNDKVRYINIPKPSMTDYQKIYFTKEDNSYQTGAYYNLLSFIPTNEEIYFHFNFMELSHIALLFKKNHKYTIILTVHFTFWSLELLGDVFKLNKIIDQPTNEWEGRIQKSFLNEKLFLNEIADHIIAIANHSAEMMHNLYKVNDAKITIIPNGLEDYSKVWTNQDKIKIRERFCIKENEKILLFVGRLTPVKGIGELIEAYKLVLEQLTDVRLIIVGEGSEKDLKYYLKQCFPIWAKVIFTGFIPKDILLELYAIANIGLVPSIYEEFGFVAVEMMRAGLPVIVNSTTGLNEIVDDNINGTFVKLERDCLESFKLFSFKIVSLLQNNKMLDKYAHNGRKKFMERYTSLCFCEHIMSFYKKANNKQKK